MNILYNIKSLRTVGGIESIVVSKANYLADIYGFNVTIVTTDDSGMTISWNISHKITIENLDIGYDSLIGGRIKKVISKFFNHRKKLTEYLRAHSFDIIINVDYEEKWMLPFIKTSAKTLRECHFHRYVMYNQNKTIFRKIHTIADRWLSGKYTKLVVLTDKDLLQWNLDNTVVIPNFSRFRKSTYKKAPDESLVIAVGRLAFQKGFDILIDIWKAATVHNEFNKKWKLAIVGSGSEYDNLKEKIKMLSLSNSVSLTGLVNNMEDIYEKASILTCSSRWEGFGLFIVEAFSYGIPCISFDCPCGPSEIIQDNTGFLIPEGDADSFCEKLIEMMNNDDQRHFMGRNAFERSRNVFAEDVVMRKWKELFEDMIKI